MRAIETHVEITATPQQVWTVLTDFAAFGDWNPFITEIAGPVAAGERLRVTIRPVGGKPITMTPTVTAADQHRRLGWLGHLGFPHIFDGAHEFVLEPTAEGRTLFTQRETFHGILVPLVGKTLERARLGFEQMNEALRQRAEAVAVASGTGHDGTAR